VVVEPRRHAVGVQMLYVAAGLRAFRGLENLPQIAALTTLPER